MKIDKVINNNLVRSFKDGKETLVMGKGLGFKKQKDDFIDEASIERLYVIDGEDGNSNYLEMLLSNIPYSYIQTTNEIVRYASNSLDKKLDDTIWLALTDHIYHAIDRAKKGKAIRNALLWEIGRFYNHEYLIAKEALNIVRKRHDIQLTDSDAGFIALHIVNAQMDDSIKMQETLDYVKRQKQILDIVKYHYNIELNESSIHYDRFFTHIKYFVRRIIKSDQLNKEDLGFMDVIKSKYPEEYKCAKKIEKYVNREMNRELFEDDLIYLAVHIRKVIEESI